MASSKAKADAAAMRADVGTIRDVISPWAGMGPPVAPPPPNDDVDDDERPTLRRAPISSYVSFGERVLGSFGPLIESYAGPAGAAWIDEELRERGEPTDLVSALAFGHALVTRIADAQCRDSATRELETTLRTIKETSLVPPPIKSTGRPPRNASLDRRRDGR